MSSTFGKSMIVEVVVGEVDGWTKGVWKREKIRGKGNLNEEYSYMRSDKGSHVTRR